MNDNIRTSFLTFYIQSLGERTRDEKSGTKFGFDWIIYNLGIIEGWTPHRLPFLRTGSSEISITKTEPEFGIDLSFISPDRKTLRIFVLKDEVLKKSNWDNHNFDNDIRQATTPDLKGAGTDKIESVEVILAYNKDEDRTGISLFERLTQSLGTRIGDCVSLSFSRWNLTIIVEKVQTSLLTPSLLPQKFYSLFTYICSQFADFRHGSDEWNNQMVPNWRRFLEMLLSENSDERCLRLLPVSLLILQEHGKENRTRETAWIDLVEWGMLEAWNVYLHSKNRKVKASVEQMWFELYLYEIQRYYEKHQDDLSVPFSLNKLNSGGYVDSVASAVLAHWHIARIGILDVSLFESLPLESAEDLKYRHAVLLKVSNIMTKLISGNPSSLRPLIDIHHIELFLTWFSIAQVGRGSDLYNWLIILTNRLFMRRVGNAHIPFIEGRNSIELVFEYTAKGEKPTEFCDTSSVYLTCLLELICHLPIDQRDELLTSVYHRLVQGKLDCGGRPDDCKPINLMQWIPPEDWGNTVLTESQASRGECCVISFLKLGEDASNDDLDIYNFINTLVNETREKRNFKIPNELPLSVIILACLKHQSPLPPEVWRQFIFTKLENTDLTT